MELFKLKGVTWQKLLLIEFHEIPGEMLPRTRKWGDTNIPSWIQTHSWVILHNTFQRSREHLLPFRGMPLYPLPSTRGGQTWQMSVRRADEWCK